MTRRPCPVCGTDDASAETRVAATGVWEALREQLDVDVPEAVRTRHAPVGTWTLATCARCGMQHFPDASEGDASFYRELSSSPRYYEPSRWEFDVVRAEVADGVAVLDIGCGRGAFLRGLPRTCRRVGLDHNTDALDQLTAGDASIEALSEAPDEHARCRPGAYDVVTAFQVLEHLERPGELLSSARRLVRPEGTVYVSVPNVERTGQAAFEPLDHPPHHVTRWSERHLEMLGEGHGLALELVRHEPPDESVRMQVLTGIAERHLRWLPTTVRTAAVRAFRRSADSASVRRRLVAAGFYERRHVFGHTMLARFRPTGQGPT